MVKPLLRKGVDPFSKQAHAYLLHRPTYPTAVMKTIERLVGGLNTRPGVCIDVGCGSGQATRDLSSLGVFSRVVGVDRSAAQLKEFAKGMENVSDGLPRCDVHFAEGDAHSLCDSILGRASDFAPPITGGEMGKVTAIVAAQAAHWFDLEAFYDETHRLLKTAGSPSGAWLVFIGYATANVFTTGPGGDFSRQKNPARNESESEKDGKGREPFQPYDEYRSAVLPFWDDACDRVTLDRFFAPGSCPSPSWVSKNSPGIDAGKSENTDDTGADGDPKSNTNNSGDDAGSPGNQKNTGRESAAASQNSSVKEEAGTVSRNSNSYDVHEVHSGGVQRVAIGDFARYLRTQSSHVRRVAETGADAVAEFEQRAGEMGVREIDVEFPFFVRAWRFG